MSQSTTLAPEHGNGVTLSQREGAKEF